MKLVPFIVGNAADALQQIEASLGPDAVIVRIRRLPARGLSRLWRRYRCVEVLAGVPEAAESEPAEDALPLLPLSALPELAEPTSINTVGTLSRTALLSGIGLLPACAGRVLDGMPEARPGGTVAEEVGLLREALARFWKPARTRSSAIDAHVFVGPAGVGKTTVLCKWLAQTVLVEGLPARVWRLDGARANTAESLSVYCAILDVPEERFWKGSSAGLSVNERLFFDLPGVDLHDARWMEALRTTMKVLPFAQVHLVVNGAYDASLLLAQVRSFVPLPVDDVIVTHLDEETRWGKLWNLPCGAGCALRYLSAGQDVPGKFIQARPELLWGRGPVALPTSIESSTTGGR